ncbi:MAG: redoxin domain-containing protein [Chloroflexota bacterium]|nr:redoxin domain-containing protein [Chloroflexota bacterium]
MTALNYRYPHFTRGILLDDMAFRGGPYPGQPLPDFDLPTTDGGCVHKRDFVGRRPLLLTCTSITCPMAATMGPGLRRLHAEFGDRVAFVTLYVREAHPGECYPQPTTLAQKIAHAQAYQAIERFPWPVAVDTASGDLHRALDPRPNAAYLMDAQGNVAFRALASNDERVLREGLQALASGQPLPIGEREPLVIPTLKAMGVMRGVLELAGQEAVGDLRRELPGVYPLLVLAALFRPLPPLFRGMAVLAIGLLGLLTLLGGLGQLLRR